MNPDTALSYNNLESLYYRESRYEIVIEYLLKAYKIVYDKLGESHPNTKTVYENLKSAYLKMKPNGKFEQWLEEKAQETK